MPLIAVALLALLTTACGVSEPSQVHRMQVDTVMGVVHVSNYGSGAWDEESAWRAKEVLRFGGVSEPASQLFVSQLVGADVGPDGHVYVLDHMAGQISVFSISGEPLRTVGRRGRGPADLATPTAIGWDANDFLWVSDPGNRKFAVYDSQGTLIETHPHVARAYPRRVGDLRSTTNGRLIGEASVSGDVVLYRVSQGAGGSQIDSVLRVPRENRVPKSVRDAAVRRPGADFTHVMRHYIPRMMWALDPSEAVWVAYPDRMRFVKLSLDGDTAMVVTADHRVVETSRQDEEIIGRALAQGGISDSEVTLSRPLFQSLSVVDGYLLVQLVREPGESSPLFDVFAPDGRYLGEFDIGFPFNPLSILRGGRSLLLGAMLGDLDVPYVVGVSIDG